jgi:hypothetical protein
MSSKKRKSDPNNKQLRFTRHVSFYLNQKQDKKKNRVVSRRKVLQVFFLIRIVLMLNL